MKCSLFPCSFKTEIHSMWFQTDFYALILLFFGSFLLRLPFLLPLLQNATQVTVFKDFIFFTFFPLNGLLLCLGIPLYIVRSSC